MKYMVDLNILKSEMERRGIRSVEELSERSRINKRELLLVLNGKQLPAMDIMVELASALELSPEKAKEIFLLKICVIRIKLYCRNSLIDGGMKKFSRGIRKPAGTQVFDTPLN